MTIRIMTYITKQFIAEVGVSIVKEYMYVFLKIS